MGLVATLLSSTIQLARLRDALGARSGLVACTSWSDVHRAVARESVGLVVLDLFATGMEGFRDLRKLRRQHPSVTLVLYVSTPPTPLQTIFELGRFGADGLIVMDQDDTPAGLRTIVEQAEARSVTAVVRSALGNVRPTARDATLIAITRAHQRLTPQQLASVLGIRRRALATRLEAAGFPPPQRLITWGRLIVAAQLLEDVERSADSVALALDFPSGSAFRNTCQRYVRRTPLEIRRDGGARCVIAAMVTDVAVGRSARGAGGAKGADGGPNEPALAAGTGLGVGAHHAA
ncbi:MAG: helix-turn-helix domain-containing protein [Gemmatimonadaceae bacterium]